MNQPLNGQWADSLLQVEQFHLIKLLAWAAVSVTVGTAILALLRARRAHSPLLVHFGVQSVAWGIVDAAIAIWARQGLALRDLSSAVALDRFVWFNIGLDLGYVGVGATLAIIGARGARRPGLIGAGLGVVVQGLALTVLDLQLASGIVR
jgi:hypothetical protein